MKVFRYYLILICISLTCIFTACCCSVCFLDTAGGRSVGYARPLPLYLLTTKSAGVLTGSISLAAGTVRSLFDGTSIAQSFKKRFDAGYSRYQRLRDLHLRINRRRCVYPDMYQGNPCLRTVAVTIDDGPHPHTTLKLLAILKRHRVKATFFVVGKMAERYPYLVEEIYLQGHEVANHTYSHKRLTYLSPCQAEAEWQRCNKVIKEILGFSPDFCRPPGGNYNLAVTEAARKSGLTTVLWSDDPGDYADPGDDVLLGKFRDFLGNGAIIILHDGGSQTLRVLPEMIAHMKKKGYEFRTISEMARETYRK